MGGSEWHYIVEWTPDVSQAFTKLQDQVFVSGDYYKIWEEYPGFAEDSADEVAPSSPETAKRMRQGLGPQTIQQAQMFATTEGTHSILDMNRVGNGDFGAVSVLGPDRVARLLGTATPDVADVDRHKHVLSGQCSRWQGVVVTLYFNGEPSKYLFSGCSGD